MDFQELISRFGLALGVGLLFGLERGWRTRGEPPGGRTAGIRTFAISGVLGSVLGAIAQSVGGVGSGIAMGLGLAAFSGIGGVLPGGKPSTEGLLGNHLGRSDADFRAGCLCNDG